MLKLDWSVIDVVFKLIEMHGWTQHEAARRAGLRPSTLSGWKRGQQPNTQTLEALARIFPTTVTDLYSAVPQSRDRLVFSREELRDLFVRTSETPNELAEVLEIWDETRSDPGRRQSFLDIVRGVRRERLDRRPGLRSLSTGVQSRRKRTKNTNG